MTDRTLLVLLIGPVAIGGGVVAVMAVVLHWGVIAYEPKFSCIERGNLPYLHQTMNALQVGIADPEQGESTSVAFDLNLGIWARKSRSSWLPGSSFVDVVKVVIYGEGDRRYDGAITISQTLIIDHEEADFRKLLYEPDKYGRDTRTSPPWYTEVDIAEILRREVPKLKGAE